MFHVCACQWSTSVLRTCIQINIGSLPVLQWATHMQVQSLLVRLWVNAFHIMPKDAEGKAGWEWENWSCHWTPPSLTTRSGLELMLLAPWLRKWDPKSEKSPFVFQFKICTKTPEQAIPWIVSSLIGWWSQRLIRPILSLHPAAGHVGHMGKPINYLWSISCMPALYKLLGRCLSQALKVSRSLLRISGWRTSISKSTERRGQGLLAFSKLIVSKWCSLLTSLLSEMLLVLFFLLKQGISDLHLNVATDMNSVFFMLVSLNNDLKKDQRESQNWIYRSPLFLLSHLKSLGHLRPIRWTDLVHCPQEDLSDQWAHWRTPGTVMLSPRRVGMGWTQGTGRKWESSFV